MPFSPVFSFSMFEWLGMTSCLAEFTVGSTEMLSFVGFMDQGLFLGQALKWLPTWLTPLWLIGVGLGIGALVSAAVFGLLAMLSFVPAIGTCVTERASVALEAIGKAILACSRA